MMTERKTIVVSAVNLRKGGTLTILRDCLRHLSSMAGEYRIVALVHKRELCDFPGIEYIEMPDVIKSWVRRLWCEYVTMYKVSERLHPVYLWLSLHDTTPRVKADIQAVYCQTSFPFYRWSYRDFMMDYKIPLFAMLTKYAYKINIRRNKYVIVQAEWLKEGLGKMLGVSADKFLVAPPQKKLGGNVDEERRECHFFPGYTFLYAATPDCHKNFETLCRAAALLEKDLGQDKFRVILTISGTENKYAGWLYKKWGNCPSIDFTGFMSKKKLYTYYQMCNCLVFPSKVETWGLPVSEFMVFEKPMLLADLPYAHETSVNSRRTAFFSPSSPENLKELMKRLITGDASFLSEVKCKGRRGTYMLYSWGDLFNALLKG
ncbi:MAG: glycosyltransferase family 4 protein [Bacteroides sp.]|nr:glycosyltransferase family 4 protein [Roseburia sp.]MCM1346008.1 glycosyltransferase family 4 protein [Bacteroides sp.]MCM1421474.1 glycosyltransferase family 4 protein [Bacteroides sp.]